MRYLSLLVLFLVIAVATASEQEIPRLWSKQADIFWKMDFSDEVEFKKRLKNIYKKIYSGSMLKRLEAWVESGSLASEHFSAPFKKLRETKYISFAVMNTKHYQVNAEQTSCYSLSYNPPIISSIVNDYNVTNYTQLQVNEWRSSINMLFDNGELCLEIKKEIILELDKENKVINEKHNMISTKLEFKPNKASQQTPKSGAAEL